MREPAADANASGARSFRVTQLTPGTGHFYCGNCLRDSTLGTALRRQGHDVTMIPLYLPVFSESELPPQPPTVFLGGINIYLQHAMPILRRMPGFVRRWLDSPGLLRWSARQGDMTDAGKHADLAVAILDGEGASNPESDRLLKWMAEHDRPDVVFLCNALLCGLARSIKDTLNVPVIATLHGEDAWLDAFPERQRRDAWRILGERARDVDAFIAVSKYYGDRMRERLGLPADKVHVVHNGISLDSIAAPRTVQTVGPPTIGYLARMCREKGLHTLVDAFISLRKREGLADARLIIAGVQLRPDRAFVASLMDRLRDAGAEDAVDVRPNVSREAKLEFLQGIDVLSVPATYGEAFGLYLIEAMAHGVPVVQPEHGAFPEIIDRSGGGLLCRPDDPESLADGLERVLTDPELAGSLARGGREAVEEHFNDERMASEVVEVCTLLAGSRVCDEPVATAAVK